MTHNALDPGRMSATERLDEVAAILAAGIARFVTRRGSRKPHDSNGLREGSLNFPADKSVYRLPNRENGGGP